MTTPVFDREAMKAALAALAGQGVYLGTSSWKYPGWQGQLYDRERYVWRGKYAETRFERSCLEEYAQVFKTVCVDAAYYKFPDDRFLDQLFPLATRDFLFTLKVTDTITIKHFPNLPRFGLKAGQDNADFLNADLFATAFLKPLERVRENLGLLMFEFSRFYPADFARGRDFVEALDGFLGRLPSGWLYGVEIRNRNFLKPEYFAALARHGVAHVYNSWDAMPPVEEQFALNESRTVPGFFGARFLLRPGRKYDAAVKAFSPYNEIKDPYPEGRSAGAAMIRAVKGAAGKTMGFLYVNNRFEGNALQTIAGMIGEAAAA
jgi:uncharacterized protein YecE (DUF72 family)